MTALTGPQHYEAAQQLVTPKGPCNPNMDEIAMAQVHALLALTAIITTLAVADAKDAIALIGEWRRVLGEEEPS